MSTNESAKPVAWMRLGPSGNSTGVTDVLFCRDLWLAEGDTIVPLYAHPATAKSECSIPTRYVMVDECDFVPHTHPQYGPGMFCTEDCIKSGGGR